MDGDDAPVIFLSHFIWIMCDIGTIIKHDRCDSPLISTIGRMTSGSCGKTTLTLISVWMCNLVQPQPPAVTGGGNFGTLIVHQNHHEQQVACFISAVIISDPNTKSAGVGTFCCTSLAYWASSSTWWSWWLCALREQAGHDVCSLHIGFALFRVMNQSKPMMDLASPSRVLHQWVLKRTSTTSLFESTATCPKASAWLARRRRQSGAAWTAHPADGADLPAQPEDVTARSLSSSALCPGSTRGTLYIFELFTYQYIWLGWDETSHCFLSWWTHCCNINAPWDDADRLCMFAHKHSPLRKGTSCESFTSTIDLMTLPKKNSNVFFYWSDRKSPPSAFFVCAFKMWIMLLIDVDREHLLLRKSTLIPRRSNKASIIRLAGVEGHCFHEPWRCQVWINGNLFSDEIDVMELNKGDYVRIDIPFSSRGSWAAVRRDHKWFGGSFPKQQQWLTAAPVMVSEDMSIMQIGIVPLGQQCKLDTTSVVEGPEFAVPLEAPEPPGRPELHLGEHLECMDGLHRFWWLHSAVELEEEGACPLCHYVVHRWYEMAILRWTSTCAPFEWSWTMGWQHCWSMGWQSGSRLSSTSVSSHSSAEIQFVVTDWGAHVLIVQNPLPDHRSVHIAHWIRAALNLGYPAAFALFPLHWPDLICLRQLTFCMFVFLGMSTAWSGGVSTNFVMDMFSQFDMGSHFSSFAIISQPLPVPHNMSLLYQHILGMERMMTSHLLFYRPMLDWSEQYFFLTLDSWRGHSATWNASSHSSCCGSCHATFAYIHWMRSPRHCIPNSSRTLSLGH